ncbi:Acyl-coenzyme A thioesterase [Drechslerella dactyloides]|uniref:Acyl-coenzyme A thioesterase n=1 Tax=Drechslerella dactyloides TaxID=74499 RepID=A0AAD6IRB5_DREDA|nr:Acyl-coenzyme A thioesterase [Drechslerella dactyloides]
MQKILRSTAFRLRRPSLFHNLERPGRASSLLFLPRRYVSAPAKPTLLSPKFTVTWLKALELKDKQPDPPIESPPKQSQLTPKRMTDSYSSYTLEFGKDEWLVDSYVNATGQLRLGAIFMDLDALAGVIAYRHAGPGYTIVTAAVDRISVLHPPTSFCDMELRGMVTWTSGRSSMEISLEVVANEDNKTILTCQFTMVALDPTTKKATAINPLIVETAEEKRVFARGEGKEVPCLFAGLEL